MSPKISVAIFALVFFSTILAAQHPANHHPDQTNAVTGIEPQPLLAQAIRLKEALSFLGSSLSKEDEKRLMALQHQPLTRGNSKSDTGYTRSLLPGADKY